MTNESRLDIEDSQNDVLTHARELFHQHTANYHFYTKKWRSHLGIFTILPSSKISVLTIRSPNAQMQVLPDAVFKGRAYQDFPSLESLSQRGDKVVSGHRYIV